MDIKELESIMALADELPMETLNKMRQDPKWLVQYLRMYKICKDKGDMSAWNKLLKMR